MSSSLSSPRLLAEKVTQIFNALKHVESEDLRKLVRLRDFFCQVTYFTTTGF